jgi:hypothetical protein
MDKKLKGGKKAVKRKVIGNELGSQSLKRMTMFFSPVNKNEKKATEDSSRSEKMATEENSSRDKATEEKSSRDALATEEAPSRNNEQLKATEEVPSRSKNEHMATDVNSSREIKFVDGGLKALKEAIHSSEYTSNFPIESKQKIEAWKIIRFGELKVELKETTADAKKKCRVEMCIFEPYDSGLCRLHYSIAGTVTHLVNGRLCKTENCSNKALCYSECGQCLSCEKGDMKISTTGAPLMSREEIREMLKKDFEPAQQYIEK